MIKKIGLLCLFLLLCSCNKKATSSVKLPANTLRPIKEQKIYQIAFASPDRKISEELELLVVGLDDGGETSRSDVMMRFSIHLKTGEIFALSIPRDLYFQPTERTVSELKEKGVVLPTDMKISELVSLAAGKNNMVYLQRELTNLLQLPTEYYIKMDIRTFERLVDLIGGVDMDIPEGGIYYDDPIQDLKIAIPGGLQHLDGENAIKFLRYRATYPNGDLGRIQIQQQFIQTFYKTLMEQPDRKEKLFQLAMVVLNQAEKNFSLQDLFSYTKEMPTAMPTQLETATVPTHPDKINGRHYLVLDEAAWSQMDKK